MSSPKNIQIPEKLLIDVYKLLNHLKHYEFSTDIETLTKSIQTQIDTKFEQIEKRKLYTESKTGATQEQKEQARTKYLDKVGISQNFRY
jgi:hypothetical protein